MRRMIPMFHGEGRAGVFLLIAGQLVACQSQTSHSTTAPSTNPSTTSAPDPAMTATADAPSSPPRAPAALELTYEKHCPGMEQARSVNVSSARSSLSLADESGEARLIKLSADHISALADALRKADIDRLSTVAAGGAGPPGPSGPRNPCTITLHVSLDGMVKNLEESPTSMVNDAAAWKAVVAAVESFATARR
jgi:hypothetical protein